MIKCTCFKKAGLILFFSICGVQLFAQCPNVDFELGNTSNWICGSGTFGSKNFFDCNPSVIPTVIKYDGNCLNEGGINGTHTPTIASQNRHTLMTSTSGTDPKSLNTVPTVAPPSMFPDSVNNYSFRIGNAVGTNLFPDDTVAYAEAIKYSMIITPSNAGLTFMYALFIQESVPSHHIVSEAPHFVVKITDGQNQVIDCGYYEVKKSTLPIFKLGLNESQGQWYYTDWKKVALDLSPYIGQLMTIEFITADCFPKSAMSTTNGCIYTPGVHSSYAYIDMYCAPVEISAPVVCGSPASIQLCAASGFATYKWDATQPGIQPPYDKQCVTVNNPVAGTVYKVETTTFLGGCPRLATVTLKGANLNATSTEICEGEEATLTATGADSYVWQPGNVSGAAIKVSPLTTTTYTVTGTVTTGNCPGNTAAIATVTVREKAVVDVTDLSIHQGETATLNGSITGGTNSGIWTGGMGTYTPNNSTLNATYTPTATEESAGSVQLTLTSNDPSGPCPAASKTMTLAILPVITEISSINQDALSIEVYPNPFNTELNILITGALTFQAELKLYDYLGKEVTSQKLENGMQKLHRGNLTAGMYFLEIGGKGNVYRKKKIIIQD